MTITAEQLRLLRALPPAKSEDEKKQALSMIYSFVSALFAGGAVGGLTNESYAILEQHGGSAVFCPATTWTATIVSFLALTGLYYGGNIEGTAQFYQDEALHTELAALHADATFLEGLEVKGGQKENVLNHQHQQRIAQLDRAQAVQKALLGEEEVKNEAPITEKLTDLASSHGKGSDAHTLITHVSRFLKPEDEKKEESPATTLDLEVIDQVNKMKLFKNDENAPEKQRLLSKFILLALWRARATYRAQGGPAASEGKRGQITSGIRSDEYNAIMTFAQDTLGVSIDAENLLKQWIDQTLAHEDATQKSLQTLAEQTSGEGAAHINTKKILAHLESAHAQRDKAIAAGHWEDAFGRTGSLAALFGVGATGVKRGFGLALFCALCLHLPVAATIAVVLLGAAGAMASSYNMERVGAEKAWKELGHFADNGHKHLSRKKVVYGAIIAVYCAFAATMGEGIMGFTSTYKALIDTLGLHHLGFAKGAVVIGVFAGAIVAIVGILALAHKYKHRYAFLKYTDKAILGAIVAAGLTYAGYHQLPSIANTVMLHVIQPLAALSVPLQTITILSTVLLIGLLIRLHRENPSASKKLGQLFLVAAVLTVLMLNPITQGAMTWGVIISFSLALGLNEMALFQRALNNFIEKPFAKIREDWNAAQSRGEKTEIAIAGTMTALLGIAVLAIYTFIVHHFWSLQGPQALAWVVGGAYALPLFFLFFDGIYAVCRGIISTPANVIKAKIGKAFKPLASILFALIAAAVILPLMAVAVVLDGVINLIVNLYRFVVSPEKVLDQLGSKEEATYVPCSKAVLMELLAPALVIVNKGIRSMDNSYAEELHAAVADQDALLGAPRVVGNGEAGVATNAAGSHDAGTVLFTTPAAAAAAL